MCGTVALFEHLLARRVGTGLDHGPILLADLLRHLGAHEPVDRQPDQVGVRIAACRVTPRGPGWRGCAGRQRPWRRSVPSSRPQRRAGGPRGRRDRARAVRRRRPQTRHQSNEATATTRPTRIAIPSASSERSTSWRNRWRLVVTSWRTAACNRSCAARKSSKRCFPAPDSTKVRGGVGAARSDVGDDGIRERVLPTTERRDQRVDVGAECAAGVGTGERHQRRVHLRGAAREGLEERRIGRQDVTADARLLVQRTDEHVVRRGERRVRSVLLAVERAGRRHEGRDTGQRDEQEDREVAADEERRGREPGTATLARLRTTPHSSSGYRHPGLVSAPGTRVCPTRRPGAPPSGRRVSRRS